jgi:hypothetical protein
VTRLLAGVAACVGAALAGSGLASAQINTSRAFGPGRCGPVDPTYLKTVEATGGQLFLLSPSELAASGHVMGETSRGGDELIAWATETAPNASRQFALPVDPSIERISLSAMFDGTGGSFALVSPDGRPVTPKTQGVSDTVLNCGRVIVITAPQTGIWRATVTPSQRFWLAARARTDLALLSAEFVRRGGRPGHQGWFEIHGQPIAGRPAMLRVRVSEPQPDAPEFRLMSPQGQPIQVVKLDRVDDEEFLGRLDLPEGPFRVTIQGRDGLGVPYQRLSTHLFRAELVEVIPEANERTLAPGQETSVTFTIRNAGPAARFRLLAVDGLHFASRVDPQIVELEAGAERGISVLVRVAPTAPAGTSVDLILTASAEGGRPTTNSAILRFTIGKQLLRFH